SSFPPEFILPDMKVQFLLPSGFILLDMKVHNNYWIRFWHSIEKIIGNRYIAKCTYCNSEMPDHSKKLHSHILICTR
ncbi:2985_t:CDS:1, partial [Scutellospora calospora]